MNPPLRRLIHLLLLWVVTLCPAHALIKVRLQLDWYPDAERGGYLCAQVNGYYRDAGLDVQIIPAGSGNPMGTALAQNQVDIALGESDDVMLGRANGIPLVCFMATMQHNPLGILVHDASPVKDFPDLEGKGVGLAPGATWFLYITRKYHLQKVQEQRFTISVGNFLVNPNMIQQAFVTSEPYVCAQHNVKVRMLLVRDAGFDPYRVAVTSDRFLKAQPEALRAFVQASIKGWKQYLADTPESAKTDAEILRLNPSMTQDHINYSRKALREQNFVFGFPDKGEAMGKMEASRYADLAGILKDLKVIPSAFDEKTCYTLDYCHVTEP